MKPNLKEIAKSTEVPESTRGFYIDCDGFYATDFDGNATLLVSSDKYKSPMYAFEKLSKFFSQKMMGKLK